MRNHVITLNVKIEELKKGNQRLQRENEALTKLKTRKDMFKRRKICSKGERYVQEEVVPR